jgi:hypothetical protein
MAQPKPISIRSYRIYFRDLGNALTQSHKVELTSDEDARELAALMLEESIAYSCAEVWDRARLVGTVRKGE